VIEIYLDKLGLSFETHKPLHEFQAFYEAVSSLLDLNLHS